MDIEKILAILKVLEKFDKERDRNVDFWEKFLRNVQTHPPTIELMPGGFEIRMTRKWYHMHIGMVEWRGIHRYYHQDFSVHNSHDTHRCDAELIKLYDRTVYNDLLGIAT